MGAVGPIFEDVFIPLDRYYPPLALPALPAYVRPRFPAHETHLQQEKEPPFRDNIAGFMFG